MIQIIKNKFNYKQILLSLIIIFISLLLYSCSSDDIGGVCVGPLCIDREGDVCIIGDCECDGDGAKNLKEEHREILKFAGWLDYVENKVSKIHYYDSTTVGDGNAGYAHCGNCDIDIANKYSDLEVTRIIVHEAAHLHDNCKHGEEPAETAAKAFMQDYNAKIDSGELFSNSLPIDEIQTFGKVKDFFPLVNTDLIATIVYNGDNGSNLYVVDTKFGKIYQITYFSSGQQVNFCREKESNISPIASRNPWSISGDTLTLLYCTNESNAYDIGLVNNIYKSNLTSNEVKLIYTDKLSMKHALLSPDQKYVAISYNDHIVINEFGSEKFSISRQDNIGTIYWVNKDTLIYYDESVRQLKALDFSYKAVSNLFALPDKIEIQTICSDKHMENSFYVVSKNKIYKADLSGKSEVIFDNTDGYKSDLIISSLNSSGEELIYSLKGEKQIMINSLVNNTSYTHFDKFVPKYRSFFINDNELLISTKRKDGDFYNIRLWKATLYKQ